MTEVRVRVEDVRLGGRHRKDLGDIARLAASIKAEGLINPITITPQNLLLAGERRLAAVRSLGHSHIDARVVDTLNDAAAELRVERDENAERKDMTPSELVALGAALEKLERPGGQERRRAGGRIAAAKRLGRPLPSLSPPGEKLNTEATVAAALGTSQGNYYRARSVVAAAHNPEASEEQRAIAQQALADMDAGATTVTGAYERVKNSAPVPTGAIHRTRIESPGLQRRAIASTEAALSGICHGLAQIVELHPDITSEEAALWVGSLSKSRRAIDGLIRQLRERTNAQGA